LSRDFDARVRVECRGAKITSDTGLLAYRVYGDYLSNHERYDDAPGNLRPGDVYEGRAQYVLSRSKAVQHGTL